MSKILSKYTAYQNLLEVSQIPLAHTYGMSCLGKVIDIESFIQIFLRKNIQNAYLKCV
jgi:hypothetical protein